MRLIMTYSEGDGCTYSCDNVLPIEHESPEAALVDFEEKFNAALKGPRAPCEFTFADKTFLPYVFFEPSMEVGRGPTYIAPNFQTVDEWFNSNGVA